MFNLLRRPRGVQSTYPHADYPQLGERHVAEAKLFRSCNELIASLNNVRAGVIAEH